MLSRVSLVLMRRDISLVARHAAVSPYLIRHMATVSPSSDTPTKSLPPVASIAHQSDADSLHAFLAAFYPVQMKMTPSLLNIPAQSTFQNTLKLALEQANSPAFFTFQQIERTLTAYFQASATKALRSSEFFLLLRLVESNHVLKAAGGCGRLLDFLLPFLVQGRIQLKTDHVVGWLQQACSQTSQSSSKNDVKSTIDRFFDVYLTQTWRDLGVDSVDRQNVLNKHAQQRLFTPAVIIDHVFPALLSSASSSHHRSLTQTPLAATLLLELLDKLAALAVKPTFEAFTAALSACSYLPTAERQAKVQQLISHASSSGFSMSPMLLEYVIAGLRLKIDTSSADSESQSEKTLQLMCRQISPRSPTSGTFTRLMREATTSNDSRGAMRAFELAISYGVQLDSNLFVELMRCLQKTQHRAAIFATTLPAMAQAHIRLPQYGVAVLISTLSAFGVTGVQLCLLLLLSQRVEITNSIYEEFLRAAVRHSNSQLLVDTVVVLSTLNITAPLKGRQLVTDLASHVNPATRQDVVNDLSDDLTQSIQKSAQLCVSDAFPAKLGPVSSGLAILSHFFSRLPAQSSDYKIALNGIRALQQNSDWLKQPQIDNTSSRQSGYSPFFGVLEEAMRRFPSAFVRFKSSPASTTACIKLKKIKLNTAQPHADAFLPFAKMPKIAQAIGRLPPNILASLQTPAPLVVDSVSSSTSMPITMPVVPIADQSSVDGIELPSFESLSSPELTKL